MAIHRPLPDLFLADLDLPLDGFRGFLGAWLLRRRGVTLLVDPGPRATVPALFAALRDLAVDHLDAMLLTHVHIDHAGGAGLLLQEFPAARVVCHPAGIPHLLDPTRLWEGSRKVLGDLAEAYGEIVPVPPASIGYAETLRIGTVEIRAVETPGHAPHHLSFLVDDVLFAGEVAGIHYQLPEGTYQRPATPPPFFPGVCRDSLDRAAALGAPHLCFGHYGYTEWPAKAFQTARAQLDGWMAVVEKHLRSRSEPFEEAVLAELLEVDPDFALFRKLSEDVRSRERFFFSNTLTGMRECLQGRGRRDP